MDIWKDGCADLLRLHTSTLPCIYTRILLQASVLSGYRFARFSLFDLESDVIGTGV